MSVDYNFAKRITMSDLSKMNNVKFSCSNETQLWVIERGEEWLQIILQNYSGDYEKDSNECISEFTNRGHGAELIRDISVLMNSKFITDSEVDDMIYANMEKELSLEEADAMWDKLANEVAEYYCLEEIDGNIIKKAQGN